jgi:hypothetical protein
VRGEQHDLARPDVGDHRLLVVGQEALHDVGEALGGGHVGAQVGVARVAVLGELAARLDRRRRGVVAAAPEHELLLAELREGLLLVLAL